MVIVKIAMTHLWSLPMVGLGVFDVSQISSLGQNVVNVFFFTSWRNERRLFLRRFSEHRVERGVVA